MNSESRFAADRAPQKHWGSIWIGGAILFLLVAGLLESQYRKLGHQPEISDTKKRWSYVRSQVASSQNDVKKPVVLLGDSQMQLGFDLETFKTKFPERSVYQLAVAGGKSGVPSLAHFASDQSFNGTILCSMTSKLIDPATHDIQHQYVQYYEKAFSKSQHVDIVLLTPLQTRLAILNPRLSSESVAASVASSGWPKPSYYFTKPDRTRVADFGKYAQLEKRNQKRVSELDRWIEDRAAANFSSWELEAIKLRPMVEAIQARGGQVVFVRYPSIGRLLDYEMHMYPKKKFWDNLNRLTNAKTVHFQDIPSLSGFNCPDMAHLDGTDVPQFTSAMLDHISESGWLK
jgi:hypothetical protein